MKGTITLLAAGVVEPFILSNLCQSLADAFACQCSPGMAFPIPLEAFDPRREQYSAEVILYQLPINQAGRVLGIVDQDLYVPGLNFVFGLADRQGKRAVIALPRLKPGFYGAREDQSVFLKRALKEAVHELGHTFGLGHCADRRCVMTFSNSLVDTDYKGEEFCTRCIRQVRG